MSICSPYICMPHMFVHPQYVCMSLHMFVHPHTPLTAVFYVPYMSWGLGGASVHPIHIGVFWGHQFICQAFWCLLVHPLPSVHNSHASCSPLLWVAFLLGWMPMDVCYAYAVIPFGVVSLCFKLLLLWL